VVEEVKNGLIVEEGGESDDGSQKGASSYHIVATSESPNPIRAAAGYNTGQPAQEDAEEMALGDDPEQALPAQRTEVQPPELGIAPLNNDNLETI